MLWWRQEDPHLPNGPRGRGTFLADEATGQAKEQVRRQFSTAASAYLTSAIHASGADLALLPEICGLTGAEEVLDAATATGHTALALAPYARRVVGVDLTPVELPRFRGHDYGCDVTRFRLLSHLLSRSGYRSWISGENSMVECRTRAPIRRYPSSSFR